MQEAAYDEVSLRLIHSRVRIICWVGPGMEDIEGSQTSTVFPAGKPAAFQREASMDRARREASLVKRALMTPGWFPALRAGGGNQVLGEVVPQPHPRSDIPWPGHAGMAQPPGCLDLRDR